MEVKIGGTVRQIEAGDELSGSIINPHPLLFNILKTHTPHILSRAPAPCNTPRHREARMERFKDPLLHPKRSRNDFPLRAIVFSTRHA